jgi:hypothetical protein
LIRSYLCISSLLLPFLCSSGSKEISNTQHSDESDQENHKCDSLQTKTTEGCTVTVSWVTAATNLHSAEQRHRHASRLTKMASMIDRPRALYVMLNVQLPSPKATTKPQQNFTRGIESGTQSQD